MAQKQEKKQTSSSSFPFFKVVSFLSLAYLVILALEINVPYLEMINRKIALLTISVVFLINILTGGKGGVKEFRKKLAKELVK